MTNQKTPEQGGRLRERIIDALVMSPLSDYAGVDMTPFSRTADMILEALPAPVQGAPIEVNEAKLAEVLAAAATREAVAWGTIASAVTPGSMTHLAHAISENRSEWLRGEGE